jgi:uncharacterized protein YaeQ
MALKATIYKANLQLGGHGPQRLRRPWRDDRAPSVRDRRAHDDPPARLRAQRARHDDHGALEFAKDLWDTDEPALWRRDLTGRSSTGSTSASPTTRG